MKKYVRKNLPLFLILFLFCNGFTIYYIFHLIDLLSHPLSGGKYGEVVIAVCFTLWGIYISIDIVTRYFSARNKRESEKINSWWQLFFNPPDKTIDEL
jgi:hypothetical protein